MQNASVPQAWFLHFYVVGVVANVAALALQVCHLAATVAEQTAQQRFLAPEDSITFGGFCSVAGSIVVTALLLFHLTRRLLETACLLRSAATVSALPQCRAPRCARCTHRRLPLARRAARSAVADVNARHFHQVA